MLAERRQRLVAVGARTTARSPRRAARCRASRPARCRRRRPARGPSSAHAHDVIVTPRVPPMPRHGARTISGGAAPAAARGRATMTAVSDEQPGGWARPGRTQAPPAWTPPRAGRRSSRRRTARLRRRPPARRPAARRRPGSSRAPPGSSRAGARRPARTRPPPPPPKPGIIPLRPLGVGEILDGAITAIRALPAADARPLARWWPRSPRCSACRSPGCCCATPATRPSARPADDIDARGRRHAARRARSPRRASRRSSRCVAVPGAHRHPHRGGQPRGARAADHARRGVGPGPAAAPGAARRHRAGAAHRARARRARLAPGVLLAVAGAPAAVVVDRRSSLGVPAFLVARRLPLHRVRARAAGDRAGAAGRRSRRCAGRARWSAAPGGGCSASCCSST